MTKIIPIKLDLTFKAPERAYGVDRIKRHYDQQGEVKKAEIEKGRVVNALKERRQQHPDYGTW